MLRSSVSSYLRNYKITTALLKLQHFKDIHLTDTDAKCVNSDTYSFSILCPDLSSCPTKYSCNLKKMGLLQNAISNTDLRQLKTINITDQSYEIIKPAQPYECVYAYKDISSAITAFNKDACTSFYTGLTDLSNWTWNKFTQKTSPQWGWPYKCIGGKDCSAVTDGTIPWSEYHYVDKNSCSKGIYWNGVHSDGSVQILSKKCVTTQANST